MSDLPAPPPASASRPAGSIVRVLALLLGALCVLPMAAVAVAALTGSLQTGLHLAATRLPEFAGNTVMLVALVAWARP
jgi:iron(III) transport system permease protein